MAGAPSCFHLTKNQVNSTFQGQGKPPDENYGYDVRDNGWKAKSGGGKSEGLVQEVENEQTLNTGTVSASQLHNIIDRKDLVSFEVLSRIVIS